MDDAYIWKQPDTERMNELQLRRDELDAILQKRRGKPGFSANSAALEAELASLDEEIAKGSDGASRTQTP